jgi:hypothetical protein
VERIEWEEMTGKKCPKRNEIEGRNERFKRRG